MPDAAWLVNLLVLIVLGIVGWTIKKLDERIEKQGAKHEKLKDSVQEDFKDVYKHLDGKHTELRGELTQVGESIRKEIQTQYKNQTDLIVNLLTAKKNEGD